MKTIDEKIAGAVNIRKINLVEPVALSVAEYAKREGISRQWALQRIYAGKVRVMKIGKAYLVLL